MEESKLEPNSNTTISTIPQLNKNQLRVQRQRQLALQQLLDRPPDATNWTTLPNVLITYIAQSYLSEGQGYLEGPPDGDWGERRRQCEIFHFALTCRHICRVLTVSYRWQAPVHYYFACDLAYGRMYVTDHYPVVHCDPSRYLASWPMPSGLPRRYRVPHPSFPDMWELVDTPPHSSQPEASNSSGGSVSLQSELQQSSSSLSSSSSSSSAPTITASTTSIESDEEDESESHILAPSSPHSPLLLSFRPSPIGRRSRKQIVIQRYWTQDAGIEYRMKHGHIMSEDTESKLLQLPDFSWLPHECEHLQVNDSSIDLPELKMSAWARLHTITLYTLTRAMLMRSLSHWPPHLYTLIVLNSISRSMSQKYEDENAGREWNGDPAHNVEPDSIMFPPTLTELVLPNSVFSSNQYRLRPDLIPWPQGLKKLTYCGPATGRGWKLPESLTQLTLTSPIPSLRGWIVPKSLKTLILPQQYKNSLEEITWPTESLTEIRLGYEFSHSLKDARLPGSLLELSIRGQSFAQPPSELVFPSRLTSLTLEWNYLTPLTENEKLNFPDSITRLHLDRFNVPLEKMHLPASLTYLRLPSIFNHSVESGFLPAGLREVSFGDAFNQPIEGWIVPPILESLRFGAAFNHPLVGVRLPLTLRELHFGVGWNQALRGCQLPDRLKRLNLGSFNQPMKGVRLPERLSELVFSIRFTQVETLMKVVLPQTLRSLTLPSPERFATSVTSQRYREYVDKLQKEITVVLHPKKK